MEKDKSSLVRQIEEFQSAFDVESKARSGAEKIQKQLELQLIESQAKNDEQTRQISDFGQLRNKSEFQKTYQKTIIRLWYIRFQASN